MKRIQFLGIFDLGLSMLKSFAASTETPVDDTAVRYAEFARNDPSFEAVMDKLFGPETAPLIDPETGVAEPLETTAEALAEPSVQAFVQKENLSAEDVEKYAAIFIGILSAIRKARQQRKAGQTPAAG